ncbi:AMP-binding protein [Mesorhizobium caraganae]|uniref:AMP-binding protein n=1 Tax=Mesorhizobium caraganae TaxID=483206 RepID=UPI00177AFEAB|nr:AMP-binding protein [Mesorhizobium caraganae]MBM2715689.1 AMP-binding protein [Mesorhizobium caraganae]
MAIKLDELQNATHLRGPAKGGTFIAPVDGRAHVSGDRSAPLLKQTIPTLFSDTVSKYATQDAAVFLGQDKRFTWSELSDTVDTLAAGFLALGLEKGDRVGIWSPNRWEWLVTQFATARIGLILVNINPAYRLTELEYALNKVGCKALVTAASFKTSDYLGMIETLAPELAKATPGKLKAQKLPTLKIVIRMGDDNSPGMFNFADVLSMAGRDEHDSLDRISEGLKPGEAINIQFTSGTTGAPKGATLTHTNIVNNGNFVTAAIKLTVDDRLCIPVPLYHCFGMSMGTMGCVTKGATMVFPGEGFDAGATLKAVAQERCTGLYGVPTMFVAMLDHADFASFDLSSLRTGIMAGSPCPIEVMKKVVSLMHMEEVTIAYGMTETSPVSFQSSVDDPLEKRVSTVGRIHPHVEVKAIDAEGATVAVGAPGELCTRGYSVMKGYWDDAEKTAEAIDSDGWMHTGDLATIDAEGYCNIVGRVKDMVIRGGENVYPREVEEFLYRHPKVKEVQVFGIPDTKYGEELCAWIVLNPNQIATEQEIRNFCAGQIAHYKIPRYIRFRTELPMTVTGKPQKFLMREAMVEELGLVVQKTA